MLNTAERSVSYAALSFYDPDQAPLEPRPPRSLIPLSYFTDDPAEPPAATPDEPDANTETEQEVSPEDDGSAE
jgi:hypothetical protein